MSELAAIFANPRIEKEVNDIIKYIKSFTAGTLLDCMLIGPSWSKERVEKLMSDTKLLNEIKDHIKNGTFLPGYTFKNFGPFDVLDCNRLYYSMSAIHNHDPKLFESMDKLKTTRRFIKTISYLCLNPSFQYSIKIYLHVHDKEDRYDGFLPYTSPVNKATQFLFGRNFIGDPMGHTDMCKRIGAEIGKSPMYVNTAFYVLGVKL